MTCTGIWGCSPSTQATSAATRSANWVRTFSGHKIAEALLEADGRELLRIMYEEHLNLRAQAEPDQPVVGSDDQVRTHRCTMPRKLMSLFGPVEIYAREGFRGRGAEACAHWTPSSTCRRPPTRTGSGGAWRAWAVKGSFDEGVEELAKTSGATVGKRQFEQLTRNANADFDAF